MHCTSFIILSLAAITIATEGIVTIDTGFQDEHEPHPMVVIPIGMPQSSAADQSVTQRVLYTRNDDNSQAPEAAQRPVIADMPLVTQAKRYLDQDPALRYLPKPGPMPTTTPNYPEDMAAHMSSVIAAEMAKANGEPQNPDTVRYSSIIFDITSLNSKEISAQGSMSSLSRALETERANFLSASASLAEKEREYRKKTGHMFNNSTSLMTPGMSLVGSLAAAVIFAGLAFVL